MNKLKELADRCKNSVTITINDHRDFYELVTQNVIEDDKKYIAEAVWDEMVASDTVVRLQFYPITAIGHYVVYHHDIEAALDEALEIMNTEYPVQ